MNDTTETDIDEWRRDYEKNFDSKYRGASKTPPTAQTVTSILKHHDRPVKQPEATSKDEPDEAPLIPEGEYTMRCLGHTKRKGLLGTNKFNLKMQIQGGAYDGTILYKYYNIRGVTGEGRIVVGIKSDLLRQYYAVTGAPGITRLDRFPMSVFDGLLISATVVTVKKDWDGDGIPAQSHYSRVGKLIGQVT